MRRNLSALTLAVVSLVCLVLLAACSTSTPVLLYITITPTSASTSVGGTAQFTGQAYYSNGTVKDGTALVAWSSSNSAVATVAGVWPLALAKAPQRSPRALQAPVALRRL